MFITKRLRLRAFNGDADAENLLSIDNDALVAPLAQTRPIVPCGPKRKEVVAGYAEKAQMFCVIEELDGGAFVGFISFMNPPDSRNRLGEMGISLLPPFWNKGYGREAMSFVLGYGFRALGLHRVALGVFEGNERAYALYRSLGFVEEGRARKALWNDGGWKDIIFMGILEEEWEEKRKEVELQKVA